MRTKRTVYLLIGVIVLSIITLAMFLLCPQRDAQFWITYVFTVIGVVAVTAGAAFMKPNTHQFAANLTSVTITGVYLTCNIVCSLLLGPLLPSTAAHIYLVAHIVLLGVFLVIWLLGRIAIQYINEQDQ